MSSKKKQASRESSRSPRRAKRIPSRSESKKKRKFIASTEDVRGGLKIVFQGEEMDPSMINALRRVLMSEIKTYSLMGDHMIMSNTSQVFKNNEYVIDRISMIPINVKTNEDGAKLENLQFYLCEEGEKDKPLINHADDDLVVSAYSFQIFDETGNKSKIKPDDLMRYDYPILKLRKGEEFHYKGKIEGGCGWFHATWKGCRVSYKFEIEGKSKKLNEVTGLPLETVEEKKNYKQNRWGNPENISLTLKSVGHYEPAYCFRLALETLEEKLLMLSNLIENPRKTRSSTNNSTSVEVIPNMNIEDYVQIKIQDMESTEHFLASHTIGNLLWSHMYFKLYDRIEEMSKKDSEEFMELLRQSKVSYRVPHPLDKIVYLDVKTPPGFDKRENPAVKLVTDTIETLVAHLNILKEEFKV